MIEGLKEKVENGIKNIAENGIEREELDTLYKLVDIHKDLANEEYWEKKKEVMEMNYRGYSEGGYGRRGGYSEGGSYGRRGVKGSGRGRYSARGGRGGSYQGEEMLEEMQEHYGNYSEGKESYGAEDETMKALEYMLEAVVEFIKMLEEEAESPEEIKLIKHYSKKISEM